jgi:hypothetical protein
MRRLSGHLSGDRPIEPDSDETDGVLGTRIALRKTAEYLGRTGHFIPMLDTKQGIRSSLLFTSTGGLPMHRVPITIILFAALIVVPRFSEGQAKPKLVQQTERFEANPGWEGFNNRVPPKNGQIVKQDFSYSPTHFAGRAAGEVGGVIQRSTTPASHAAQIAPQQPRKGISQKQLDSLELGVIKPRRSCPVQAVPGCVQRNVARCRAKPLEPYTLAPGAWGPIPCRVRQRRCSRGRPVPRHPCQLPATRRAARPRKLIGLNLQNQRVASGLWFAASIAAETTQPLTTARAACGLSGLFEPLKPQTTHQTN